LLITKVFDKEDWKGEVRGFDNGRFSVYFPKDKKLHDVWSVFLIPQLIFADDLGYQTL
jgi:hypothetical protein